MVRGPAPNTPVELSAEEVPERCEKLLLQLSVGFSNGDSKLQEGDHHVSGCLNKLATLLRPQSEWCAKFRVEGHAHADETEGIASERALAVYRWLVDGGHAQPGTLRIRANNMTTAERCVVFRPIRELRALSGP